MMSLYPEAVQVARAEIDSVIGRERIPELADRDSLPYMDAFLQELMRLCPVAPLGMLEARLLHRWTKLAMVQV
jgi:cytochrome P450